MRDIHQEAIATAHFSGELTLSQPLAPVTSALAAFCSRDRPAKTWLTLLDNDSTKDQRQLHKWWVEIAWKDSLCLQISPWLSHQPPAAEFEDETEQPDSTSKIQLATKIITFDEYKQVALFFTFRDLSDSLHFFIFAVHSDDTDSTVHLQMALSWVSDRCREVIGKACDEIELSEGGDIARRVSSTLATGLSTIAGSLSRWLAALRRPFIATPMSPDTLELYPWVEYLATAASEKKKLMVVAEVVNFTLTRYRTVFFGSNPAEIDKWLSIVSLFQPTHRAAYCSFHVSDRIVFGLHVQGLKTRDGGGPIVKHPFENEKYMADTKTLIDGLPSHYAGCSIDVDALASHPQPNAVRATEGHAMRGTWSTPLREFSTPLLFVVEAVDLVARRCKLLKENKGNRYDEWRRTNLLLQQWRQQLLNLTLFESSVLQHNSNDKEVRAVLGIRNATMQVPSETVKRDLSEVVDNALRF